MISIKDLRAKSRAHLRDAKILLQAKRFDGAAYLCGYAVELGLKARICQTLKWAAGFPESAKDFKGFQSLKTHDLEVLLGFSGIEARVKAKYLAEWSEVIKWTPEKRYQAVRQTSARQAADMVTSVERLLAIL